MSVEAWRLVVTVVAAIAATAALLLNAVQFRRIDRSIHGSAYQQLANQSFEIKKILLQYQELDYLSIPSSDRRRQEVFESLLRNYIENFWAQSSVRVLDPEIWIAFDGLLRLYRIKQPSVLEGIVDEPNFAPSLREHAAALLAERPEEMLVDLRDFDLNTAPIQR